MPSLGVVVQAVSRASRGARYPADTAGDRFTAWVRRRSAIDSVCAKARGTLEFPRGCSSSVQGEPRPGRGALSRDLRPHAGRGRLSPGFFAGPFALVSRPAHPVPKTSPQSCCEPSRDTRSPTNCASPHSGTLRHESPPARRPECILMGPRPSEAKSARTPGSSRRTVPGATSENSVACRGGLRPFLAASSPS